MARPHLSRQPLTTSHAARITVKLQPLKSLSPGQGVPTSSVFSTVLQVERLWRRHVPPIGITPSLPGHILRTPAGWGSCLAPVTFRFCEDVTSSLIWCRRPDDRASDVCLRRRHPWSFCCGLFPRASLMGSGPKRP